MKLLSTILHALKVDQDEEGPKSGLDRRANSKIVERHIADPEFPYLISFPRTGSHWLRMLMELYFDRPSLTLLFFRTLKETDSFTCLHTHDLELSIRAQNVLYLYRNPVDTVFSQMSYHDQDLQSTELVEGWTELYAQHVAKWVLNASVPGRRTIVTYEGMRRNLAEEFSKVCAFFGEGFDADRLARVSTEVSKDRIRDRTRHDPKVIASGADYENRRHAFRFTHGNLIHGFIQSRVPGLASLMPRE